MSDLRPCALRVLVLLAAIAGPAAAQSPPAGKPTSTDEVIRSELFVAPPDSITAAVLAPRYLNVSPTNPSPDKLRFVHEVGDGPVGMETFSKPYDELGGLFIDFGANRNRNLTIRNAVRIELISATDGAVTKVETPGGARVSNPTWSPDGRHLALYVHTPDATHIWVADAATGRARQVTRTAVLATLFTDFSWTADSRQIATVLIPAARGARPTAPKVPVGPQVKLAEENDRNMLRTYQSLMATPTDQAVLAWHTTGQLALVDVASRAVTPVGAPAMIRTVEAGSGGPYLRVTRMVEPFSYIVPVSSFGTVDEIWSTDGTVMATIDRHPLNLGVDTTRTPSAPGVGGGDGSIRRREIAWRADGKGLSFLELEPAPAGADSARATDDAGTPSRRRDRVMLWPAPFDSSKMTVVYSTTGRITNHRFSPDHTVLIATERTGQNIHEYAVVLSDPDKKVTLARYRADDVYSNPGNLILARSAVQAPSAFGFGFGGGPRGARVVDVSADGQSAYYYGVANDKNPLVVGPRSFIDRVGLRDGKKTRVFESDNANIFERVLATHDIEARRLVVARESQTAVPQAFLRDGDRLTQLTRNVDYTPDLTNAPRESFIVERPDGFKFKVNVTLPPGYQPGTRLPAMFWFYPREFASQDEYDRGARTFNKNEFPNFGPRSIQYMVRLGYAVVEPDAPIVGSAGQQNNNYENDLRNNLAAVIDEVDRRGLVDRTRMGIGGHSYGAFSTVNAMSHTPFFKAGIAGDGNY
ncbi:MAG: S9 family peptidase, partial [Gemmatimonadales bacterium]